MLQFPKGFYFGSATSATQSEGASAIDGKGKNIWDIWFEQEPRNFMTESGRRRLPDSIHSIGKIFDS